MRVALFPIGITPTKPLTPTHIKGVLYLNALEKFLARDSDVEIIYNQRIWNLSLQTIRFWSYFDRCCTDVGTEELTDVEIGNLYVASNVHPPADHGYAADFSERIRSQGYVHDVSRRILSVWNAQLAHLGADISYASRSYTLHYELEEIIDFLRSRDCMLDLRSQGGPVYLDLTQESLPLRLLISKDGNVNYLVWVIGELMNLVRNYDLVYMYHDNSVDQDYSLLQRLFSSSGAGRVKKIRFMRVPLDGSFSSSKQGGWQRYTFENTIARLLGSHDDWSIRAASRVYFLHSLGLKGNRNFDFDACERVVRQVQDLKAKFSSDVGGTAAVGFDRFCGATRIPDIYGYINQIYEKKVKDCEKVRILDELLL